MRLGTRKQNSRNKQGQPENLINRKPGAQSEAPSREKILAEKKIPALVISFAIPTIIGMMVNAIYNVVDRFWIGKMEDGAMAMAGVGLTLPITTVAFAFMALIGIGATALISIRLGERRREEAEQVLGNCASFSFIFGAVITVLGILFAEPLLRFFGASARTMPFALDYIYVILAGNVVNTIQFAMSSVMRGVGHPTWCVTTQVAGAVANMILDPFFIFSSGTIRVAGMQLNLPFGLGMGVKGAAAATVLAQFISFGIVVIYYAGGKSPVRLHLKNMRPRIAVFGRIAAIGSSSFAMQCAASVVQIAANMQLAKYGGDLAISAMTLVNSIAMFCVMPIIGIVQGVQPIIGFNYGAKNYIRVRSAYFFAAFFACTVTALSAVLIQVFPEKIISLFSEDPELTGLASNALRITLLLLPPLGYQIISANYFQFIGRSFISLTLTLLRQVILLIPLYYILPPIIGIDGVWYATPVSDIISLATTIAVISWELRHLQKKIRDQKPLAAAAE